MTSFQPIKTLSIFLKDHENGLDRYQKFTSVIASIFTIIGVIVAAILLWTTLSQIKTTNKIIRASTIYTLAKDGRELNKQLLSNNDLDMGLAYNYLHSFWIQRRFGILDEETWIPIQNEICGFLKANPEALSYWDDETKKYFNVKFVKYIEDLGKKPECRK